MERFRTAKPDLDPDIAELLSADIEAELAKRSFRDFVKLTDKNFIEYHFHKKLFSKLEKFRLDVLNGKCPKLYVGMPPRNYKTQTAARFGAYCIGREPSWNAMFIGHEASLAEKSGRLARDVLREHGSRIFNVFLSTEKDSAKEWETTAGGGAKSLGAGASPTGRGFNILIIDDPVKGIEEAFSRAFRDAQIQWYRSDIETRRQIQPKPLWGILFIMARWHKDDLIGKLLQEEGDTWDQLVFPAYDENTAEWLDPSLEESLKEVRNRGGWIWRALYQQKPTDEEGGIFKRDHFQLWTELPKFDEIIQSWDLSFKDNKHSSRVAGGLWGFVGADAYLLDLVNKPMNFTATLDAIRAWSEQYPKARRKLVEDKANGPAILNVLKSEVSGLIAVTPEGGKEARAYACQPMVESGNVYLPANKNWTVDVMDQCADFPNSDHDDIVDQMTQALNYRLRKGKTLDKRVKQADIYNVKDIY